MPIVRLGRRIQFSLLVVALISLMVVSLPQREAAAATACTATPQGEAIVLTWGDDGSSYNVRRNGSWLANAGTTVSSYVDDNPPANATYELVVRQGESRATVACVSGVPPVENTGCSLVEQAGTVVLSWDDNGGRHIVRRNGRWLATPGPDVATYTDTDPTPGASYLIRTRLGDTVSDRDCVAEIAPPTPPPPAGDRRFVVHVSIDGLRADAVTWSQMPILNRLENQGAATMNARTDPSLTKTLPNHTSQFTGRFVWGTSGHRVNVNDDNGQTIHDRAGSYVASVFDVVSDNGGRTVVYNGKQKFNLIERSYDSTHGAIDTTGVDDGRDKIDVFVKEDPQLAAQPFVDHLVAGSGPTFGFFHIRTPDEYGHSFGWGSGGYHEGLRIADGVLAELIDQLDSAGVLGDTTLIVTADHGGPAGDIDHSDSSDPQNFTVPFIVWGADVAPGVDLYDLNPTRTDPGIEQLPSWGPQPIRGHDAPNLALDLLGYPSVPGSVVNADQSLRVR